MVYLGYEQTSTATQPTRKLVTETVEGCTDIEFTEMGIVAFRNGEKVLTAAFASVVSIKLKR